MSGTADPGSSDAPDLHTVTIATDEDTEIGFLLVDSAPDSAEERLALFIEAARVQWDMVYRREHLSISSEPQGYAWNPDDGEDVSHLAEPGEEPNAGVWWVITGLAEAEDIDYG